MGKRRVSDAMLEQMQASEDPTVRAHGVIAAWLRHRPPERDEIAAARDLVRVMADVGLSTCIRAQLDDYIEQVKNVRHVMSVKAL